MPRLRSYLSSALIMAVGFLSGWTSPLSAAETTMIFKDHGKVLRQLTLEQLEKLSPAKEIRVVEPHLNEEVAYVGFPANDILKSIYGAGWTKMEELLFTCIDGYQPNIAVRQFQDSVAYFSYKKADGSEFSMQNKQQDTKVVPLGPFYLVWENIKDEAMKEDGGSSWPYQVNAVDSINFSEKYPNLAPPKGASAAVHDGFLAFRKRCFSCHTINGQGGGASGIELNYPMSVTEYFREDALVKFISQPKDVRWQSPMPPFSLTAKDRKQKIAHLVAYLKAMAANKKPPTPKP